MVWSSRASGSVVTGAILSLLTIFAEQPPQLLRTLMDDPDLEGHMIDTTYSPQTGLHFSSRGLDLSEQEKKYMEIADSGPEGKGAVDPFVNPRAYAIEVKTTEDIQKIISTITIQIWILLTKAVTAPDTAKESETKRWVKYLQQKRVDDIFRLKNSWLDVVRAKISEDISIRRLMVNILIAINRSTGTKGRLLESIADIGNYISEAGMASFFLTIKYGIETKLPALALNEFQGDLTTMIGLMKLYKEQGERAPFLTILEDSIQTKFAPGNYSLLWSFAMGVGVTLDRSMNNLNFNRPFLEPNYFRLGQEAVSRMEGNIDSKMAADLGLTDNQIIQLRQLIKDEGSQPSTYIPKSRTVDLTRSITDEEPQVAPASMVAPAVRMQPSVSTQQDRPTPHPRSVETTPEDRQAFQTRMEQIRSKLSKEGAAFIPNFAPLTVPAPLTPATQSATDIDVMNAV